ncbi:MAG: radical SAM protein, partial [Sulfitobacter sp.]|nr:radical SAM protein [Sulfitobacter sp.]
AGHVEIVLCGIHIGHWGRDLGLALPDLLQALVDLELRAEDGAPLDFRVRLSSIEATEVCDRTLDLMAGHPERIAPHLHLPLQSGSNDILVAMNRWYDTDQYLAACDRIRGRLDRPALSADVLVGFPGETEAHFLETLETSRQAGFCRMHIFPFSARAGTPAATMGNAVQPEQVRDRRMRLSEWASQSSEMYARSLEGVEETVIMEGFSGLSGRYQRIQVDPSLIEGPPPPCLRVRVSVEEKEALDSTPEKRSYKVVLNGTPIGQPTAQGSPA